ncbi:hypothetical protein [Phytoactinopolyspora limicola]|uniref:hypothetical protein n=1 Tax=Phytoactinopolyspora limicola TaxID=2715536 RepID=UPI00140A65A3|nr:hypothetical protein [Phytoactinopolyspora limicola]
MFGKRSKRRQQQSRQALEAGTEALSRGDIGGAIHHHRVAADAVRERMAAEPADAHHPLELGSVLSMLGELLMEAGAWGDAVDALDEAHEHLVAADADQPQVADVRMRRARAHTQLGHRASALVDAQAAVVVYQEHCTEDDVDPLALDLARVLAQCSLVTLTYGDPDAAAAAADHSIRIYLERSDEANADASTRALHGAMFRLAAEVSESIHHAYGRTEIAEAAGGLAAQVREASTAAARASGDPAATAERLNLPGPDHIRANLTLAEALDRVGEHQLRGLLTKPAQDGAIVTAADRISIELAPGIGAHLAEIVDRVIDHDEWTAMRIALEAHALLALASEEGVSQLRLQLAEFGVPWARMLMRCSRATEIAGFRGCALDFAGWMAAVVSGLMPHAMVDQDVRLEALHCLSWHAELLTSAGDVEGAQHAQAAAAQLSV